MKRKLWSCVLLLLLPAIVLIACQKDDVTSNNRSYIEVISVNMVL